MSPADPSANDLSPSRSLSLSLSFSVSLSPLLSHCLDLDVSLFPPYFSLLLCPADSFKHKLWLVFFWLTSFLFGTSSSAAASCVHSFIHFFGGYHWDLLGRLSFSLVFLLFCLSFSLPFFLSFKTRSEHFGRGIAACRSCLRRRRRVLRIFASRPSLSVVSRLRSVLLSLYLFHSHR